MRLYLRKSWQVYEYVCYTRVQMYAKSKECGEGTYHNQRRPRHHRSQTTRHQNYHQTRNGNAHLFQPY